MPHIQARYSTLFLICIFSFLSSALFYAAPAHAAAVPGGNIADPNVRAVDLAKPSVVRIITTVQGRIAVRFPSANASVNFPQGGGSYDVRLSGSGTFVTATGDIITAEHVIKPPHDHSLDLALETEAAQDIADYVNTHYATSTPYGKNDVLGALESGYFLAEKRYMDASSEVYLSTDYTGPINASDLKNVPDKMHARVDTVLKESGVNQQDMALIHVKMTNTPSVQFGDSSQVAQQDTLTIIGFPGNGDISDRKDPTTFLSSSINKIFVSALKKTDSGADVIQVGGNVEHGDSGGPALDANGKIVGIVSFGIESSPPYGSTFLQSSNNAKAWMSTLGLDTKPGRMQQAWQQAFADYSSTQPGHWHKAQNAFRQISQNYPDFKAVSPFLNYANAEAQKEPAIVEGTAPTNGFMKFIKQYALLLLIAGVLFVLLLVVIALLVAGRRRKPGVVNTMSGVSTAYRPPVSSTPIPNYPYMTGNQPVAPGARGPADPRAQANGNSNVHYAVPQQPSRPEPVVRTPKEQDVIPTQPLNRNAPPPLPYEP